MLSDFACQSLCGLGEHVRPCTWRRAPSHGAWVVVGWFIGEAPMTTAGAAVLPGTINPSIVIY